MRDRNQSIANIERLQLKIVRSIEEELSSVLDFSNDEAHGSSDASIKIRFPLNQLTWREIARMRMLVFIYSEMGKSKDDIQHAIRGNKTSYYKTNKNVIRNIRYTFAVKAQLSQNEEDKLYSSHDINFLGKSIDVVDRLSGMPFLLNPQNSHDFKESLVEEVPNSWTATIDSAVFFSSSSEQDVINLLLKVSENSKDYSEDYRRCSKVLIKILGTSQAKNLMWEVDANAYPEYYTLIKRPIMLSNVAIKLINQLYGKSSNDVGFLFYNDMKQVMINCITYNTEVTPVVNCAQKLLTVLYRHVEKWLNSLDRPDVEDCDDKHCLLSKEFINPHTYDSSTKCGKCSGAFSYNYLSRNNFSNVFIILPNKEILDQTTEDWICPLCLQESFDFLASKLESDTFKEFYSKAFHISEWGPSSSIPWLLNNTFSNQPNELLHQIPQVFEILKALELLSSFGDASLSDIKSGSNHQWSLIDRLQVLSTLCLILRSDSQSVDYLNKIKVDAEKILRISNKSTFREADFISTVKDLCGEEGVALCRSLLDGIDVNSGESNAYLHSLITEGRCVVCNGSTFFDEMEVGEDEVEDQVILCDGCNAEVHLKCLNLAAVKLTYSLIIIFTLKDSC